MPDDASGEEASHFIQAHFRPRSLSLPPLLDYLWPSSKGGERTEERGRRNLANLIEKRPKSLFFSYPSLPLLPFPSALCKWGCIEGCVLPTWRWKLEPWMTVTKLAQLAHKVFSRIRRVRMGPLPTVTSALGSAKSWKLMVFAAASDWNELQKTLKLDRFISISSFKDSIMDTLTDSCGCFTWCIVVSTFLPLCCCLCPIIFGPYFVLLPCCAAAMLCCYHVVVKWCCYHAVLSCVAAIRCCCLRSLFM